MNNPAVLPCHHEYFSYWVKVDQQSFIIGAVQLGIGVYFPNYDLNQFLQQRGIQAGGTIPTYDDWLRECTVFHSVLCAEKSAFFVLWKGNKGYILEMRPLSPGEVQQSKVSEAYQLCGWMHDWGVPYDLLPGWTFDNWPHFMWAGQFA